MGSVTLVGAGCGKDLITVKGLRAIRSADVIVYDNLIDDNLLNETKSDAEIIYVGKRFKNHSEKQENINKILVQKAKENKNVVRLKGGDSFVFGRGGEEILALQEENIPYDIIPGISSSIAVPENFGIPVTHRGIAQSFTVVTGHTATQSDENYNALAHLNGTLVFLMGLHNIDRICKKLIVNGKNKNTPVSILSKGFYKNQTRIDGTLETIADKVSGDEAPAVFVVGKAAEFNLKKTKFLPLDNISVTVTGTNDFADKLSEKLTEQGAYVNDCTNLCIEPEFDEMPDSFDDFTYLVFTSSNGVKIFFDYLRKNKIDYRKISHLKFACIGSGSLNKLSKYGFIADFVPSEYTAKALGKELSIQLKDSDNVLICRAKNGSEDLTDEFDKVGINYTDLKIYDTKSKEIIIDCDTDYITFASAGGVSAFFENGGKLNHSKPVCIGEITAKVFERYSGVTPLIAKTHTAQGIIDIILEDKNETLQTIKTE